MSVIIPTRNRAAMLRLTLGSLAKQTIGTDRFEVVVVIDGPDDSSVAVVEEAASINRVKRIDLPWSGRAVARNRGAAEAQGEILCFLDDDMEAERGLLEAHLRAHAQTPGGVVLGYFPILCDPIPSFGATEYLSNWWNRHFCELADPNHEFSFRDFCTGNVSMAKSLFERVGGFDESFPASSAGEDFELGYRLLQSATRLYFTRDASSIHHCRVDWQYLLDRAGDEGRGHAVLAARSTDMRDKLEIGRLAAMTRNVLTRPLLAAAWHVPSLAAAPEMVSFGCRLAHKAGWHQTFSRLHRLLWGFHYWKGVRTMIPAWRDWKRVSGIRPRGESAVQQSAEQLREQLR